MRKKILLLILILVLAMAFCGKFDEFGKIKIVDALPMTPDAEQQVKGNNKFAWELFRNIATDKENGNIFISPYSISTALGMTYAGAKNQTRSEMSNVLGFPIEGGKTAGAFKVIQSRMNHIQSKGEAKLGIANGLWIQEGYSFLPAFLDEVQPAYDAELRTRDILGESENVCEEINDWFEDETDDCINEILKAGDLNRETVAVLVNAIHFKGAWKKPFKRYNTDENGRFYTIDDKEFAIPMMKDFREIPYMRNEFVQIIELEYKSGDLSMIIILPHKNEQPVTALAEKWTHETVSKWIAEMDERGVMLSFPRFSMTESCNLTSKTFSPMGMPRAFEDGADFSGMINPSVHLSKIIHKTFISVNEEGTEAVSRVGVASALCGPANFTVDHPFIFLIRENSTGSILFLGRVMNPTK